MIRLLAPVYRLNGDLVRHMIRTQNALQTWTYLADITCRMLYVRDKSRLIHATNPGINTKPLWSLYFLAAFNMIGPHPFSKVLIAHSVFKLQKSEQQEIKLPMV